MQDSDPRQQDTIAPTRSPSRTTRLPPILLALGHRNFRLYALGQCVSLIGTWLQRIAMGWLAYRLSDSVWILGLVGFCSQAAVFFIAPFAGVLGDRGNKRTWIAVLQVFMLFQALALAVLAWSGFIQSWHLVAIATALGVATAFDAPLRQALLADLVEEKAHLPNAIALNSLLVNLARVAGPALAGVLVAAFGEAICFALNAASFLLIIYALSRMQFHTAAAPAPRSGYWDSLAEGGRYVMRQPEIRRSLGLVAAVSWCICPYIALMPVFAVKALHGDANTLGTLLAASGAGTIIGTLYLAARRSPTGLHRVVETAAGVSGVAMAVFAWCASLPPALLLIGLAGCGMMIAAAGANTAVQSGAADAMRGRVASFYIMAFIGVAPFGTLASSAIAEAIGIRNTFLLNGALCCAAALLARRQRVRT